MTTKTTIDPETPIADVSPAHARALRALYSGKSAELLNTLMLRALQKRGWVEHVAGGVRELTPEGRAVCAALFGTQEGTV